jgi:short-subunit dehydrogenase
VHFNNKVIWITGASSGIGEELAYRFAKDNAKLVISSNDSTELERVRDNCLKITDICSAVEFDLAQTSDIDNLTKKIISEYGRIDVLINNGGISQRAFARETPIEMDRKIMEINFFSAITLTKSVLPFMLKQGSGHIAVTSSITGKFGFPLRSAYSASKHAVAGYFETLWFELKENNIGVTVAYPGRVKTKISLNAIDKDGKAHGKMDAGQDNGISAERCAFKYYKAIKNDKKEVYIGGNELLMVFLKRFAPALHRKLVMRIDHT